MILKKILDAYDMSADKTESVVLKDISMHTEYVTIGVSWRLATGTLDGTLNIYVSDNPEPIDANDYDLEKSITIDAANNNLDKLIYHITARISTLKFVYTKNNITGGELTVTVGTGG